MSGSLDCRPQPWEMPWPGAETAAMTLRVSSAYNEQQCQWELRLIPLRVSPTRLGEKAFLWFHPLPYEDDAGFVACQETEPVLFNRFVDSDRLNAVFRAVLAEEKFGRLFFLNAEQGIWRTYNREDALLITPSGKASWSFRFGTGRAWNGTTFKWGAPTTGVQFLQSPAELFWKDLKRRFANANDEAVLANRSARTKYANS